MKIGIDASRAFLKKRTGIEEYSYQVIKKLRKELKNFQVVLYLKKGQRNIIDFDLPKSWQIKTINYPRLWTQIGLSLEMLLHSVDILFVPAHTIPMIHPRRTIVTIHGLEYEFLSKAYSAWERFYMRWSIKKSCQWASKIISVSENTKRDLIKLYKVPKEKIKVIYEGIGKAMIISTEKRKKRYLLFIGRIEERKNIKGIIESFEWLKTKYNIKHKLVLAGKVGYGFGKIKKQIENSQYKNDIILTGYISEKKKWALLKNASVFLFPTFYEGFGLPILEAQSMGIAVVASNNSSIPEIAIDENAKRKSALLVDPNKLQEIAEAVYTILKDKKLKEDLIENGFKNIERFSWEKCAREIAGIMNS